MVLLLYKDLYLYFVHLVIIIVLVFTVVITWVYQLFIYQFISDISIP